MQNEYEEVEAKNNNKGLSPGYIADTGESKHLLKPIVNNKNGLPVYVKTIISENVTEWIASKLYQQILPENSYNAELAKVNKTGKLVISELNPQNSPTGGKYSVDNQALLFLDIKLQKNVKNLVEFTDGKATQIEANNLEKIVDFEKVIAACHIMGEKDYHGANLLVDQKNNKIIKIDHAQSFLAIQQTFPDLVNSISNLFFTHGYNQKINSGDLKFDITEYSKNFSEMLKKLNEESITHAVDTALSSLVAAGFDNFKELEIGYNFNHIKNGEDEIYTPKNSEDLKGVYVDLLNQNLENLRSIAQDLEIIAKFSNVDDKFRTGGWLERFANFKEVTKDPVLYAVENNIQIEGKNPLIWAKENQHVIKIITRRDPTEQEEEKGQFIDVIETKTSDPFEYILNKKKDKNQLNSIEIEYKQYIEYTAEFNRLAQITPIAPSKFTKEARYAAFVKKIPETEIIDPDVKPEPKGFFATLWSAVTFIPRLIASFFVGKVDDGIDFGQEQKVEETSKSITDSTKNANTTNKNLKSPSENSGKHVNQIKENRKVTESSIGHGM